MGRICLVFGIMAVATLVVVVWTAVRGNNGRQNKVVTVVDGPPPGFEQPRYVGWVFGRMMGIHSSDYAWPAPSPSSQPSSSSQPTSDAP